MAIEHEGAWYLEIDEAAEMEEISRQEVYKRIGEVRIFSADRRTIDGRRGTLIPAKTLSEEARARWQKRRLQQLVMRDANVSSSPAVILSPECPRAAETEQTSAHLNAPLETPQAKSASASNASQMTLLAPSPIDLKIAALQLSAPEKVVAVGRFRAIQPLVNHDFSALGFTSKSGYVRGVAAQVRVTQKTIWEWYARYRRHEDIADLANERPGPEPAGVGSQALDAGARAFVKLCWEVEKLSKTQTYRKLLGYLEDKQRGCGLSHAYEFPSSTTVYRFIDSLDALIQARRQGADALKAALGHIDRRYDDLASLERVDTDEWKYDVLAYDENHPKIVRRFWLLTFYDVRAAFPLVWEAVAGNEYEVRRGIAAEDEINLLVRLAREYGLPRAMNSDRGRFRGLTFGGRPLGEQIDKVFAESNGILDQLSIRHNMPREHNPRGSRLERFHRYLSDCCRQIPGWIGSNTRERKMSPGDEQHREHAEWVRGQRTSTPLLSRKQLLEETAKWMEEWRDHESQGTDMRGLSPRAVFVHNTPVEGFRKVSDAELAWATAQHFQNETIEAGGIITLPDGKRYSHPLLLLIQGEQRECVRLRDDHSFISVLPARKGEDAIMAPRRVPVGANDPAGLAQAMEFQARLRKLASEMGAGRIESSGHRPAPVRNGPGAIEPLEDNRPITQSPDHPIHEISSLEWMTAKGRTRRSAPEPAVETVAPQAAEPEPSLYDIRDLSVEEL